MSFRLRRTVALALCLVLCEPFAIVANAKGKAKDTSSYKETRQLLSHGASDTALRALDSVYRQWLNAYVNSRVVAVPQSDGIGSASFGPWSATQDYGATEARDDGSLTEWAERYYITHHWSEYGQLIRSMVPGDVVTVNGQTVVVERVCDYPRDSVYEEIATLAGDAPVILQTCEPNTNLNRMVFART
ncbi:MAG: hypothetical protein IKG22_03870 [Atopobiaceae bacterium]|nr:hypothetical protein [Atopobiaceae bacterium]